ncbi:hypothetical protein [Sinorhizobium sp. RAC02]|uniref:hypothetical protein n=1 Tax=Sinorhizobium sp. RAC02 TaxID=1842534 RepID=UPI00083D2D40|nr:hypothetical protein [Sinorhizobium sp. RAC02]AOF88363.1 hypothetical protein BSY16_1994 [Sinorhizobium sp. RAC02]
MTIYKKVSRHDVSKETDLVVTVIHGVTGPCAFITDPVRARDTIPLPVEEALAGARQMIGEDLNPRNLVIVDEDDLWDTHWGRLVPHPERSTT